jgi:NhaP-type Na+/H+ or K+/H+ antiporter
MLFFGILLGYIFGLATRFCLRFVYNDRFVEGTLIIGMSYLCFWLGELVVGTSAVIAVVFMGLYMNWHKSALSPEVLHYMHQFYEMIAHILNTLIFAIAGTKLGALLGTYQLREILVLYWGQILAIYPIVLLTRFVAIALFFPLLSRIGTKCTWQDAVVMWCVRRHAACARAAWSASAALPAVATLLAQSLPPPCLLRPCLLRPRLLPPCLFVARADVLAPLCAAPPGGAGCVGRSASRSRS